MWARTHMKVKSWERRRNPLAAISKMRRWEIGNICRFRTWRSDQATLPEPNTPKVYHNSSVCSLLHVLKYPRTLSVSLNEEIFPFQ